MEPFYQIFPEALEPIMTLVLSRKTGLIPKGTYGFIECYCIERQCDCRRVTLVVLNEKMKQKAVIGFGFDQDGPMAGPYLDTSNDQSPFAPELLDFFVHSLNAGPDWLDRMYRQYRTVREMIDGRPYRGKPLPKPGEFFYRVMAAPDLEAEIQQSLERMRASSGRLPPAPQARKRDRHAPPDFIRELEPGGHSTPAGAKQGMAAFVERYAKAGAGGPVAQLLALQDDLRRFLVANDGAGEELAALLPVICQHAPENDEQIDAALRLLFDTLDLLRVELEDRRPGAKGRMERFQSALAQHIYLDNEDLDLCAAVSNTLLQSRVEILPVLREAHKTLRSGAARTDLYDAPGEEVMAGISRSLDAMGVSSPFEGVQAMLQLFALNEPDIQTALVAEMLGVDDPLLREISALMLFHPEAEVRLGVSQLLAAVEGRDIAPETLRRLIVSRNWFPEEIRKNMDRSIARARKARVECAALAKPPAMTVYASLIDGAGAQSFQVIVPDGKGFSSCSILLKQGVGVADAFVVSLKTRRELNDFLALLKKEASFIESAPEHLDQRICHALADGVSRGNAPNCSLVRIAELLGCDRWKAAPLDARRELAQFEEELAARKPKLLSEREYLASLEQSFGWQLSEPMLSSWFEEDDTVDQQIVASRGKRKSVAPRGAIGRILEVVLEKRRAVWLDRLVLTTLWLKFSKKAPIPWHRMFHVARVVADDAVPLKEIPLMLAIAQLSFDAYQSRNKCGKKEPGDP